MMFFKIFFSLVDALVLMFTVLSMMTTKDDDGFAVMFLYGIAVVSICLIAGFGIWR